MTDTDPIEPDDREPALLGSWLTLQQAELMLNHVRAAGTSWPEVAIYLHSCITAIRSVTLTMQKALAHYSGFADWYEVKRQELAADSEMRYLLEARNHVLKRGALNLMHAYEVSYTGGLAIEMRGVGPDGPDIWLPSPDNPHEKVPVDWRKLEGFAFSVPLRFGPLDVCPSHPTARSVVCCSRRSGGCGYSSWRRRNDSIPRYSMPTRHPGSGSHLRGFKTWEP